jgi:hypothetical protein
MGQLKRPSFGANMMTLTQTRRGKSGGQVRDEYRREYDPGRGGYGRALVEDLHDE